MAKNFIERGDRIRISASGGAISSGDLVMVGDLAATALEDIADGAAGVAQTVGVFALAHKADEAMAQGAKIYWDADGDPLVGEAGSGCLTAAATDNKYVGIVWRAAAQADASVRVKLNA